MFEPIESLVEVTASVVNKYVTLSASKILDDCVRKSMLYKNGDLCQMALDAFNEGESTFTYRQIEAGIARLVH